MDSIIELKDFLKLRRTLTMLSFFLIKTWLDIPIATSTPDRILKCGNIAAPQFSSQERRNKNNINHIERTHLFFNYVMFSVVCL